MEDTIRFFDGFISGLKKHPWLKNAYIFLVVERNTGRESQHFDRYLQKYSNAMSIKQREDREAGWWTHRDTKIKYAFACRQDLIMNSLFYLKDMVCTNPGVEQKDKLKRTKKKLYDQMRNYKLLGNTIRDPFATQRETVSGKTNESGKITAGINDDLMFVLTGLCHMLNLFLQRLLPGITHYNTYLGHNETMVK